MDLVDDRDAVLGKAFGDVHLPQRTRAVERRTGDLADQLVQFPAAAGSGYLRTTNVVVEVDVVVHRPHRMMHLQRNFDELMTKWRQRLQPGERDSAKHIEAVAALDTRHVQHADLQRVHVDLGRLGVEHQGVHAVESLHPTSFVTTIAPRAGRERRPSDDL